MPKNSGFPAMNSDFPEPQEPAPFLTARLSRIIMLSYEADPALLNPLLPPQTELDFHGDSTFVSLVGLRFNEPRVYGLPLPFYREYAQVNLRFYVRRRIEGGDWRRGVAFIKQIVPHRPVAWAARLLFNETAVARNMDQIHRAQARGETVTEYGWRSGRQRYFIRAVSPDRPVFPDPGSEEEFLLERYWGYGRQKDGSCLEYRFNHPPWRICRAVAAEAAAGLGDFYGPPFSGLLGGRPDLSFAADGSQVTLFRGRPCQGLPLA
jgi:uncharacterized protein